MPITAEELNTELEAELTPEQHEAALARGDILPGTPPPAPKAPEKTTAEKEAELEAGKGTKTEDENLETPEEKAEREKAEAEALAAAEAKKRIRIPKERVDEMQRKAREREEALNKRIQELERGETAKQQTAAVSELKTKAETLQDQYEELLVDGKKAEAKAVRVQIEELREKISDAKAAATSESARKTTIEELKYESTLSKIEADYPALNPDLGDQFDEAKAEEVAELMQGFMARGQSRQIALTRAVKYVMGEPVKLQPTQDNTKAAEQRTLDARARAAAASKQQPASTNKVGADSDKVGAGKDVGAVDIMKMTQAKFEKLDAETLSKLRGDEL